MNSTLRCLLLATLSTLVGISSPELLPTAFAADSYIWKTVTIGGGGYVLDVYCHPRQKDLVYIRTDVGGFYRWDAAQTCWRPLTDQFPWDRSNYYGGEGLALDPKDPNIVYIAAGKYAWGTPAGTIFKSNDQGRSWKKLPIDLKMGGNEDQRWSGPRLVVSPFHSSVLLFGSRSEGLWRSGDAGASWTKISAFPASPKAGIGITSLAFASKTPGSVFAAAYGDGEYESRDDGLTWRKLPAGPTEVERLACAPDGTLYATHQHGVGKYIDGQWTNITPTGADTGFGGLSIDPHDPRDVLVAAQKDRLILFRTRDGGATWTQSKSSVQSSAPWYSGSMKQIQYVSGLTFDPCVAGRVWLTDWYATYETDNIDADPVLWKNHERRHEELVVFTLAAPPVGLPLLSGVADVDGFPHSTLDAFPQHGLGDYYGGMGPTFGDTDQIAWCPTAPDRLARVGVKRWDNTGGGTISKDSGRTWTGFPNWDAKIMPGRIAISASDPNNMVVLRIGNGTDLTTYDGGASWHNVTGLPDNLVPSVWNWQVPLASDGAQAGVFYVYGNRTLYKSMDGGGTFAVACTGLPTSGQVLVAVPGKTGELYLAAGEAGLYRSRDGGKTFGALPTVKRAPLFALGKSAAGVSDPTLYLYGTLTDGRTGIFRSLHGGVSWEAIHDPHIPVGDEPNSMAASFQTFGLVFIGTNGRGIYYGMPQQATRHAGRSSQ